MQDAVMTGEYDYRIVLLSILVAMLASYTALDLAGRVTQAREDRNPYWLIGGAVAMGTGIWSMHFVAMLAFKLPIPMGYDFWITLLSWFLAVLASGLALFVISAPTLSSRRLVGAALLMGTAICGMHYTGMAAMRMQPGLSYDPLLFSLSVLIAITASLAALWISFSLRRKTGLNSVLLKMAAAVIMGIAISGMHFTGMAATHFAPGSICLAASALDATWLALVIALGSFALMSITLVVATLDRRLESRTAELVDSLRRANEELLHISLHDHLTQLPNRVLLEDRLKHSIQSAHSNQSRFALVYIDLDGFKAVNDSLGHHMGDRLLQKVAQAILAPLREADTLARMGGDEFVLLLEDLSSPQDVSAICSRVLDAIHAVDGIGRHHFTVSASMGIAIYPDDGEDSSTLMAHADTAMYHVKNSGKNGYQYFQAQMNQEATEDFRMQMDLRNAIEHNQLSLHYQPKYQTKGGLLCGAEALLRWQHPELGAISPSRFIPIAERFGLINRLENWVLDQSCQQIRHWQREGMQVPPISINLSPTRFRQDDLVEKVEEAIRNYELKPGQLILEITESSSIEDPEQALQTLYRLQSLGVLLALDDFGTGYSSLSYLTQLPVQQLKIDRSFIRHLRDRGHNSQVVHAIITLAHALNLEVIAEGVETEEEHRQLEAFACDQIQGFLLSKPLPVENFVEELKKRPA
ncbi:putative bifunctional diguanylate cyclase/phosphodiesterase [Balneatrix alpica]|uniref:putative bifunctional diguanylate cyclase/phosphodiesterase n=1 Tax=Balneatrix alpica TaxID=75684 RepID=UPI002738AC16|nr:EAL domain-containing protein [Balneatrix alpica]